MFFLSMLYYKSYFIATFKFQWGLFWKKTLTNQIDRFINMKDEEEFMTIEGPHAQSFLDNSWIPVADLGEDTGCMSEIE